MHLLTEDHFLLPVTQLVFVRDSITGHHHLKTQQLTKALCCVLEKSDWWRPQYKHQDLTFIWMTACLHDVGKVGVTDAVLLSTGNFTPADFEEMQRHPEIGFDYIAQLKTTFPLFSDILQVASDIAYSHHERWDGTGYPQRLSKEDIPLAARIVAVTDVYEAMVSRRSYKEAHSHDVAVKYLKKGRGTHFDARIVDAFLTLRDEDFCQK